MVGAVLEGVSAMNWHGVPERIFVHLRRCATIKLGMVVVSAIVATATTLWREQTNVLRVVAATLRLGSVVRPRELLLTSDHAWMRRGVVADEQLWAEIWEFSHHCRVPELLDEAVVPLDCGVRYSRNARTAPAIEAHAWHPRPAHVSLHELDDVRRVREVHEAVPNIAVVLEIDAQVGEVVLAGRLRSVSLVSACTKEDG